MDLTEHNNKPHFRSTSSSSNSNTAAATSTTTTSSELFICFTSRLSSLSSSSSMKLTKSILSPARAARDVAGASLSSSLSRRLRTNGSLKGGASPFFTTTTANNKRRGGGGGGTGFENPEPSSPKVTCIGQVRVKTKKKKKKQQQQSRSLSRRRSSGGGEVSFRKIEQGGGDEKETRFCNNGSAHYQQPECLPHRNQRWVHLPVSICEALRAFGAEFSCLFPCSKSSCFSSGGEKSGEKVNGSCENGCGAVFARWLVSVNDGEGGKRREIELVVGGGDDEVVDVEEVEEKRVSMRRSSRRHVFEDIEVKDDRIKVKGQSCGGEGVGEEESGRVSICVPPKNALLLMRCRSDPMKMADLASRFSWDAHAGVASNNESGIVEEEGTSGVDGIEEFEQVCGMKESKDEIFMVKEDEVMSGVLEQDVGVVTNIVESDEEHEIQVEENVEMGDEIHEEELVTHSEEAIDDKGEEELQSGIEVNEESLVVEEEQEEEEGKEEEEEEEVESNMSSFEDLLNQESTIQHYEDCPIQENELGEEEGQDSPICHLSPSTTESESEATTESSTTEIPLLPDESPFDKQHQEEEETIPEDFEKTLQEFEKEEQQQRQQQDFGIINAEPPKKQLPDCLLLMMCEPKLSMEVSKETWVCTTDFVKWLPQRPPKQPPRPAKTDNNNNNNNQPQVIKRRLSIDSKPKQHIHDNNNVKEHHQPPRSSCSLPAAVLEKKLVNAVAYEPFVLTRCKSEPMRTAAAKLMPESCVWKNAVRKMEPAYAGVLCLEECG